MMEELSVLAYMASFADSLFSGMLHILEQVSSHQCLWKANKILVLLLCLLELLCLCVHHGINYGFLLEVLDLF
jgi:hypothetical protein